MMGSKTHESGFVALLSILIVSVVALSVAVSISVLGVGEARNSLDYRQGVAALKGAEGCAEEALLRMRNEPGYTGGSLNFTGGSCTISLVDVGGEQEVTVIATMAGPPSFVRSLLVTSRTDGNGVTVVNWQEIE